MKAERCIYPIFLPHAGCPFQCVYCDQSLVTRSDPAVREGTEHLTRIVCEKLMEHAHRADRDRVSGEIAFYGGTFTALEKETLAAILHESAQWVSRQVFSGIRFSTRPDCMSRTVCLMLRDYPVQTVELGVQSFSDEVLDASGRKYRATVAVDAARVVKSMGWSLGIQLMPGLPGDTRERFLESIEKCVALGVDFVRLYPTLVLKDTVLARLYRDGHYSALSLEEAVSWCAAAYERLCRAGVPVARAGLHGDPQLERPGVIVAGPYHPAFGYLVRVRCWRERVDEALAARADNLAGKNLTVLVPGNLVSEAIGPARANLAHWRDRWTAGAVRVVGKTGPAHRSLEVVVD